MENNGTILNNQPEKGAENNDLKQMLQANIALSQEILGVAIYIKKYIVWQKIFTYLKLLIILVPIILAVIYLPPFFRDIYQTFLESLGELTVVDAGQFSGILNK